MKFLPLLALPLVTSLLIGLKLAGNITWSWLWVLFPVIWVLAMVLFFFIIGIIIKYNETK